MNYVKHLNLFGVDAKQIPCDAGEGAPTTSTVGAVGCLYMDKLTSDIYKCISASDDMYIWELFGNGSGSGITSWNDLADKPDIPTDDHINELIDAALEGVEGGGTTITDKIDPKLLPEGGFGYTENATGLLISKNLENFDVMQDSIYTSADEFEIELVVGNAYTVVWDGTSYDVECNVDEDTGMTYIGNTNYLTMQTGGEIPFCILESEEGFIFVATESTASSHMIEVYGNGEIVHKIYPKYLPDGVGYEENDITTLVDKTVDVDSDELYTQISEDLKFVDGETYAVTFNGTEYTCVAWTNDSNVVLVGNGDIYGGEGMGDDVPFSCDSYDEGGCYLNVTATGTYSIKIDGLRHVVHKIDSKYLDIKPLEFYGGVSEHYDGSSAVLVRIPQIHISDEDLVAGESDLESGAVYLVYE